jgi:hypothetical protein
MAVELSSSLPADSSSPRSISVHPSQSHSLLVTSHCFCRPLNCCHLFFHPDAFKCVSCCCSPVYLSWISRDPAQPPVRQLMEDQPDSFAIPLRVGKPVLTIASSLCSNDNLCSCGSSLPASFSHHSPPLLSPDNVPFIYNYFSSVGSRHIFLIPLPHFCLIYPFTEHAEIIQFAQQNTEASHSHSKPWFTVEREYHTICWTRVRRISNIRSFYWLGPSTEDIAKNFDNYEYQLYATRAEQTIDNEHLYPNLQHSELPEADLAPLRRLAEERQDSLISTFPDVVNVNGIMQYIRYFLFTAQQQQQQ